jgi:hypothetical protein
MSLIKKIKQYFANRALKHELGQLQSVRSQNKFNFDKIKTIGILFDSTNSDDYEIVKRYVDYLKEHSKKVKALGFFNAKEMPSVTYFKSEYDFFSIAELNWMGIPTSEPVKGFIAEEYDLLIDLNILDHFCLRYVSALSKAKFKVGKFTEDNIKVLDMMIDSDNTKTVKYFLRQVDAYIMMLNKVEPNLN